MHTSVHLLVVMQTSPVKELGTYALVWNLTVFVHLTERLAAQELDV
jgi:hypothetical protein